MDHRIAKDMISSGMTPSGEKTQADLGRTQYGSAPSPSSLMDAYRSIYEHHQKDKEGNTIPHEDAVREAKEEGGMISNVSKALIRNKRATGDTGSTEPTGRTGQGMSSAAKMAVERGKEHKERRGVKTGAGGYTPGATTEEVDLYDILREKFLEEGYDEKTVNYIMVELADDIKTLSEEPITLTIGALLAKGAAIAAKGAAVAGKVAAVGGKAAAAAGKAGMAAAKGVGTATKGIASAAKPVVGAATKGLTNVGTKVGQTAGKVGTKVSQTAGDVSQQVKKVATTAKDTVGQKIQDIAKPQSNPTTQTPQQKTVKDRVIEFGKKKGEDELRKDRPVSKTNKTGVAHAGQTDIAASADLFDIVKGQLLDEGLSEEEIQDIMLTLTPDEILKEIEESSLSAGSSGGHYSDGGDGVFRSKEDVGRKFNKNFPPKKNGKVDVRTRSVINTSARDFGIQGPTTVKDSHEPEGKTI